MRSPLTTVLLCMFMHAASAQGPALHAPSQVTPIKVVATGAAQRPSGDLIKSAAAGTRDDAPAAASAASVTSPSRIPDEPRHGSVAMLLASVALMAGIALRRIKGPGR